MKKILKIIIAIVLLFIAKPFIGKAYYKINAPEHIKNFSKKEALEDYDYMWNVLEKNYPCFNVLERKYGVNIKNVKEENRRKIQNAKKVDFKYFNDILNKSINKFPHVAHLYVLDLENYIRLRQTTSALNKSEIEELFKDRYKVAINKKSEETYKYIYSIKSGSNKMESKFNNSNSNKSYGDKNLVFHDIDKDTCYVKIHTFNHDFVKINTDKLLNFYKENANKKNLVIDLTRCNGGSDYYWITNIVAPNIDKELKLYNQYALYKNGDILNDEWVKEHRNEEHTKMTTDFSEVLKLPKIRKEDLKDLKYLEISKSIPYNVKPLSKEKLFKGKIYVLVSKWVQSSGESFAEYCKNTGFATLIGPKTGGNSPAMSPVYNVLPNSGLMLSYQIDYKLNPDGTCNSEFGIAPDIISKEDEEPLDTFKRVITKEK
ncbi:S41 family peptidase [Clostridium tetani]|uniref:Membrane associated protein n=3 Tax=Clostridium tetani TaxID=1513 RepID=Q892K7_CLOTE|nr:S41 family peptidase [Clostridium tetani]AAO36588.1 membrane associated protein [Clostridium tetani E88]KGI39072.1 hypothetical protein KY52_04535 [Clostridium tetani]KGI43641.1 hypothetical protein KY54_09825 [Clostridium tetani]KGI44691.1 hypothetical protein KY55_01590 [Clostridium tetani]KIG20828.1 hypothetical protein RS78_07965 [Clostridium tetani]